MYLMLVINSEDVESALIYLNVKNSLFVIIHKTWYASSRPFTTQKTVGVSFNLLKEEYKLNRFGEFINLRSERVTTNDLVLPVTHFLHNKTTSKNHSNEWGCIRIFPNSIL